MNEKYLRIGFVAPEFVTNKQYGGLGTYLYKTCSYLKELGHNPVVIVLGDKNESLNYNGIEVHTVTKKMELSFWIVNAFLLFTLNTSLRIYFKSKRINRRLKSLNKKAKFDIVQYSNAQFLSLMAPAEIKSVLRLSHYYREYFKYIYSDSNSWKNIQKKIVEHIVYKKHKGYIIGPSKTINKMVKDKTGIAVKHVASPYIPKPIGKIPEYDEENIIFYFGTYSFSKGSDLLIKVIPRILDKYPKWRFVSAGRDTPLKRPYSYRFLNQVLRSSFKLTFTQKLEQSLKKFGSRAIIQKKIPYSEVITLLHKSKIVVLPSRIDNSPNTLTEALSLNKIVVAAESSSLDELITHGENGFIFKNGDPNSLFEVISSVIDTVESDKFRIANKFVPTDAGINVKRLLQFYNRILNNY